MTALSTTAEPEDPNSGTVKSLFERDKRDWDEIYNILGVFIMEYCC